MGEANRKEQRIKDMTLADLQAQILDFTVNIVKQSIREELHQLVDEAVKARINDYHEFLLEKGVIQMPPSEEEGPPTGLWLPEGIES